MRRTSKKTALLSIEHRHGETQAKGMEINGTTALVTGSNRGLGRALVEALLDRGAARVYAAARDLAALTPLTSPTGTGARVVPVRLDLTDPGQIAAAAQTATDVRLLINNAGTAAFADPFSADRAAVAGEMDTNYLGTFDVIRAFTPGMTAAGGGAIVNVLTLLSFASMPLMAGYSASKAAAHSLTQAIRPALAAHGITVYGVYPGGIDTDMLAGVEAPKAAPRLVAEAILDGVQDNILEIYPDPMAQQMAQLRRSDPRAFEQAFLDLAAAQ
jgi:NAD(P)-dependent dehydrogenase (short-subunit alcohol dehydrogenase family)